MIDSEPKTFDARVRSAVYTHFVEETRAPSRLELARKLDVPRASVTASFERLADGKALVLQPESREILMAEPFSAVPTPFVVTSGYRSWWGNCIWDALGIPATLHRDARVTTSCADCSEAMTLVVEGGQLSQSGGVVHFARPVKDWWPHVTFT